MLSKQHLVVSQAYYVAVVSAAEPIFQSTTFTIFFSLFIQALFSFLVQEMSFDIMDFLLRHYINTDGTGTECGRGY